MAELRKDEGSPIDPALDDIQRELRALARRAGVNLDDVLKRKPDAPTK
jgi:hypothetical protein